MGQISESKRASERDKRKWEKFEETREEAAKLKEETNLIIKQSAANQLRIDLMFQILRAREENDAAKDATLTQTLRFRDPISLYICTFNSIWLAAC